MFLSLDCLDSLSKRIEVAFFNILVDKAGKSLGMMPVLLTPAFASGSIRLGIPKSIRGA